MNKKALLIIASRGFQPIEYGTPKQILRAAGVMVSTASDKSGMAISAITDEEVKVDLILDEVAVADYSGIFIVGGPGALAHLDNEKTYRIVREANALKKPFGAICISPRILAYAGVLKNKKATGWDGDGGLADVLEKAGADYVRQPVVVDGNLITANGPPAAEEFGQKIIQLISV